MKKLIAATVFLASSFAGMQARAAEGGDAVKDAWIDGKLEGVYALNRYLSAFEIDTTVNQGVVHLTGKVHGDTDGDRATEIAREIDGVVKVDNDLTIVPPAAGAAADGQP